VYAFEDLEYSFPIKYIYCSDEYSEGERLRGPNVMAIRTINGFAQDYTFTDGEFLEEVIWNIARHHNKYSAPNNPVSPDSWNVAEFGSNVVLGHQGEGYILVSYYKEIYEAAFWVALLKTFDTFQGRRNELKRILQIKNLELLEFYEVVSRIPYTFTAAMRGANYASWFNEGILGRDYHDRFEDDLSYTPEIAKKVEENTPPHTVGSYKKSDFNDAHPFYEIGSMKAELYDALDLPPFCFEEYLEGLPPLLGNGMLRAIEKAGYDPIITQLEYIEYAGIL